MNDELREFRVFSHYLIGVRPSRTLAERYAKACSTLFQDEPSSAILSAARRMPALLGPLDAACGLLSPDNGLRKRLLLAAAILETTTTHADFFLPRNQPRLLIAAATMWHGVRAVLKVTAGIACYSVIAVFSKGR